MLIARSWLQEYVDIADLSDKQLAQTLVDLGLEVEKTSVIAGLDHRIVVGEVLDVTPHPNADSLNLCQVSTGTGAPLSIVCGAHNVRKNLRVAVATIGSVLPGDFTIKAAKIRGVASEGMLCSVKELGIGDDHDGIWELETSWPIGEQVAGLLGCNETIFELSITPNRGDCLSYIGVARDLAAKLKRDLRLPEVDELPASKLHTKDHCSIEVDSDASCGRFAALYIKGAQAVASPEWMKKRLEASGLRPINLIVDITNYCMVEMGQPIHAYDARFVAGKVLKVRDLGRETPVTLLDGREIAGKAQDIVICDAKQVLGLAGVMGGAVAEVRDDTSDIIVEVAHFAPASIRKTAKRLGISTDAAMRFERGIDISAIDMVVRRIAQLFQQCAQELGLSGLVCASDMLDYYPKPADERKIALRLPRVRKLLGLYELSMERCIEALEGLGIKLLDKTDERMLFAVPQYRHDVQREIDLIEEVARMVGYDAIPYQIPHMEIKPNHEDPYIRFCEQLRRTVAGLGLSESITFPFVGSADFDKMHLPANHALRTVIALANPLSDDLAYMQGNSVAGLLATVARNRRYGQPGGRLFTTCRGYLPAGEAIDERHLLGVVLDCPYSSKSWNSDEVEPTFFHGKGLVERLCAAFGVTNLTWEVAQSAALPWLHPSAAALVRSGEHLLGWVGELHPQVGIGYELGTEIPVLIELDTKALFAAVSQQRPHYSLARRFPPVVRDFAFLVDAGMSYQQLADAILKFPQRQNLQGVSLFDVYSGEGVGAGKKSMAVSLAFAAADRTLTDQEVDREANGILQLLEKSLGVVLRG